MRYKKHSKKQYKLALRVASRSLKKVMAHAERLECLSAMADIGEEIRRLQEVGLQEWV